MAYNELVEQALKEGVTVDGPSEVKEAPKESEPKVLDEAKEDPSPSDPKKDVVQNGDADKVITSDSASKIRRESFKQAAEWKKRYEALEGRLTQQKSEILSEVIKAMGGSKTPEMPRDQRESAIELARLMTQVPEVAEMFGLKKAETLEQEVNRLNSEREEEAFNREFDQVIDSYSTKFGLDKEEMKQELADFLDSEEYSAVFSKGHRPGVVKAAVKTMYFDRMDELKERSANLKLIKEQKEKKGLNTASPSKGAAQNGVARESNMRDFLMRRVNEEGGKVDV